MKKGNVELLSSDLPTGPAGGSRAASSQEGLRRLSRRVEACDPLSAQPLASRAGWASTRDNQIGFELVYLKEREGPAQC